MKIGWQGTKLLQKLSGLLFFGPPCIADYDCMKSQNCLHFVYVFYLICHSFFLKTGPQAPSEKSLTARMCNVVWSW